MTRSILKVNIALDEDVILARQRARKAGAIVGLDPRQRTHLATAVAELARTALELAGSGTVEFLLEDEPPALKIRIEDRGPGFVDVSAVLDGRGPSETMGILAARRLVERFDLESIPGEGTRVTLERALPRKLTPDEVAQLDADLRRLSAADPVAEVRQQNTELLAALSDLKTRQDELIHLNRELEDRNRAVLALNSELEERAQSLRKANEVKTRFLSNMTHEFRTPLTSILSLSRLLADRVDGELTQEQERQVTFLRRSAESLLELVNDLLDLAKAEAGRVAIRASRFSAADLLGTVRGMLRPLLGAGSAVSLVFDDASGLPDLHTDEGKVSQILRNLVSNALKFTERGEVRVSAALEGHGLVRFTVADTGIGIAPEDQERVFLEFAQVDHPIQKLVRGTGLGLPLSRKLAELLGGRIELDSQAGRGSRFSLVIPMAYAGPDEVAEVPLPKRELDPLRAPVLVIEDSRETLFLYEKFLRGSGYQVVPATTLDEARQVLACIRPAAIVLDTLLASESAWALLADIRAAEATRAVPILVVTMIDNEKKARVCGADAFCQKPVTRDWLLTKLRALAPNPYAARVLVIDDDEASRYLLRGYLAETRSRVTEAHDGAAGVRAAREGRPDAIFLDLGLPGMDGYAVLAELEGDERTREIPVIIYTSRLLGDGEVAALKGRACAVLSKETSSRSEAVARVKEALVLARIGSRT